MHWTKYLVLSDNRPCCINYRPAVMQKAFASLLFRVVAPSTVFCACLRVPHACPRQL